MAEAEYLVEDTTLSSELTGTKTPFSISLSAVSVYITCWYLASVNA
jgi:hypothetical protein